MVSNYIVLGICLTGFCYAWQNRQGKFLIVFMNLVGDVAKKCPGSESSVKVASIFENLAETYFSEV